MVFWHFSSEPALGVWERGSEVSRGLEGYGVTMNRPGRDGPPSKARVGPLDPVHPVSPYEIP